MTIKFIVFRTIIITIQTNMTLLSPHQTQQSILITLLLEDHDSNQRIEALRQSQLVRDQKYIRCQFAEPQMKDISEKLNRLEKTLLKKGQIDKSSHNLSPKGKYEELNMLNDRLRKALGRMGNNKGATLGHEMERKISGLYNESVSVLNNQCQLNRKLSHLKLQNQLISAEISETKAEIQKASTELQSISSLKELNLRRLERLTKCAFLYH